MGDHDPVTRVPRQLCVLLVLLFTMASTAQAGKLYRWTDEQGNVHYGDRLPADASRQSHAVMDERGSVREEKPSMKEEKEARERRRSREAAEKRRTEREREEQEAQRRRDEVIMQTFATERDLLRTRDERLAAIQSQINVVTHNIERLENKRAQVEKRVEGLPADAPATKIADEELAQIDNRLDKRRAERSRLMERRAGIDEKFESYLQRFRELRAERE